jgi:hypothetical protein
MPDYDKKWSDLSEFTLIMLGMILAKIGKIYNIER